MIILNNYELSIHRFSLIQGGDYIKGDFKIIKKLEFDDIDYAKKIYKRERILLKIRLVCTICAICWSVLMFLSKNELGIFEYILGVLGIIGLLGTIISCPMIILRTFLLILIDDSDRDYWYNPAYFLVDIFLFIVALIIPLIIFAFFPFVYCMGGVIQSHTNKDEARIFLLKHIGGKEFLERF